MGAVETVSFPTLWLSADANSGPRGATPADADGTDRRRDPGMEPTSLGLLATIVSELPVGVFLVDASLQVFFTNPCGERLLVAGDGLALEAGKLCFPTNPELEASLRRLVSTDASGPDADAFPCVLRRPSGHRALEICLRPAPLAMAEGSMRSHRLALLYVRDPDDGTPLSVDSVRQRFGLTVAESRTAVAIAAGRSMDEVCERLALRPMTVRGYLGQIYEKLGIHSQADLARVLLSGESTLAVDLEDSKPPRRRKRR